MVAEGGEGGARGSQAIDTDYRRGQRFKRVTKMLMSDRTLRGLKMFKYQAWAVVAFVSALQVMRLDTLTTLPLNSHLKPTLVIHTSLIQTQVACFVIMQGILVEAQLGVNTINNIGEGHRAERTWLVIAVEVTADLRKFSAI